MPELTISRTISNFGKEQLKIKRSRYPGIRLAIVLSKISDAIELTATSTGYVVKGLSGTPNGPVNTVLQLKDLPETRAVTKINVRENPISLTANDLMMTLHDDQKRPFLTGYGLLRLNVSIVWKCYNGRNMSNEYVYSNVKSAPSRCCPD